MKRYNLVAVQILVITIVILAASLFTGASAQAAIEVSIDGKVLTLEVAPVVESERVLVPFRAIFEELGADVHWDESAQMVSADKGDKEIIMVINSPDATINGAIFNVTPPARLVSNRTMVPLRFVAEALDCYVFWDESSQEVAILPSDQSYEGYPKAPELVVAGFIIANGRGNIDIEKYLTDKLRGNGWPESPQVFSLLRIADIVEKGSEDQYAFDNAQRISGETGLPCRVFLAQWYAELTPYGEENYTRPAGNMQAYFYLVESSPDQWQVYDFGY